MEKFEASHPLALAGELREEGKKIAGVAGLERLCRVYGSSTWVEDHLKDWTDEVSNILQVLTSRCFWRSMPISLRKRRRASLSCRIR